MLVVPLRARAGISVTVATRSYANSREGMMEQQCYLQVVVTVNDGIPKGKTGGKQGEGAPTYNNNMQNTVAHT